MPTVSYKLFISVIVLSAIGCVLLVFGNPITTEDGDVSRQCMQYDLAATLNITIDNRIVAIYNAALCKRCMPKLLSFKALQLRFEIADFNDILFIVLTTEHSNTKQFTELQSKAGDVMIISLHDIENNFLVAGSIYVFDKCSRLTYELFPPWSEIQYQLVKAAILSTWYDAPCGKCDEMDIDELSDFLKYEKELMTTTDSESESSSEEGHIKHSFSDSEEDDEIDSIYHLEVRSNDTAYVTNVRTIIPLQHVHAMENNTYVKYNYIVLNSNDHSTENSSSETHTHLDTDQTEVLYDDEASNAISSNHTRIPESLHNVEGLHFKVTPSKQADGNLTDISFYKYLEVKEVSNVVVHRPELNHTKFQNITSSVNSSLMSKLRKWLSYRLISPLYNV